MARGYAVFENGEIDMKTVCESERGAKVNWLVTRARVLPLQSWTDKQINDTFQVYANVGVVQVIPVEINPVV